jgi:xylulokinase
MLPYLEGERSPIFDSYAKGVYFGMTPRHERQHFLRACLEGTSYALRGILEAICEKHSFAQMRIIGGGAKSVFWKQLIADICNIAVSDVSVLGKNATSLGAAIAAGVGIGLYADMETATKNIGITATLLPVRKDRHIYDARYKTFTQVYDRLKPVFRSSFINTKNI